MASPFFATHVLHMTIVVCSLRVGVDLRSCFETEQVSPWELLLVLSTAFWKKTWDFPILLIIQSVSLHVFLHAKEKKIKVHMEPQTGHIRKICFRNLLKIEQC